MSYGRTKRALSRVNFVVCFKNWFLAFCRSFHDHRPYLERGENDIPSERTKFSAFCLQLLLWRVRRRGVRVRQMLILPCWIGLWNRVLWTAIVRTLCGHNEWNWSRGVWLGMGIECKLSHRLVPSVLYVNWWTNVVMLTTDRVLVGGPILLFQVLI